VDQNNFRQVLSAYRPGLKLSVPNRIDESSAPLLELELDFKELEDFTPDRILARVAPLRDFCALRQRLLGKTHAHTGDRLAPVTPGEDGQAESRSLEIERRLAAQLRDILHHPAFRKLEAAWQGLHYLVHQIASQAEGGSAIVVRVWNVSKQELFTDCDSAGELGWSSLFKKVYDEEFGQRGGEPFGLLVGDFYFGFGSQDVELLEKIAGVAAASYAPFVGGVSAEFFMLDRFNQKGALRALTLGFSETEYTKWRHFQKSEDSRFVGMTLPGVPCRLPYGKSFQPVTTFAFEEFIPDESRDDYPWMNGVWAYAAVVAKAFLTTGWFNRIHVTEKESKVGGLPSGLPAAAVSPWCVEVELDKECGYRLAELGFLPLVCLDNSRDIAFLGNHSCHRPRFSSSSAENARTLLWSKINNLLCMSRFAHYLNTICRDKAGSWELLSHKRGSLGWLSDWLRRYVQPEGECQAGPPKVYYPLLDAKVEKLERQDFVARAELEGNLPYEAVAAFFCIEGILGSE
jgi:type VI secretion system protein ImpC